MLVFAALTSTGMMISLHLKKREALLERILLLLCSMKIDFGYSVLPLERIIEKYAVQEAFKSVGFLKSCFVKMQDGEDFPFAWKESVESSELLSGDEKSKLLGLGSELGTSEAKEQINLICIYEDYMKNYLKKANEACEKYCKASIILGLFSGFAAFILLV